MNIDPGLERIERRGAEIDESDGERGEEHPQESPPRAMRHLEKGRTVIFASQSTSSPKP